MPLLAIVGLVGSILLPAYCVAHFLLDSGAGGRFVIWGGF